MKRFYLSLTALLLTASVFTQDTLRNADAPDTTLIPRALFFQPKDVHDIRLSKNGERVYFQRHTAGDQALFYVDQADPDREIRLSARGRILDWTTTHSDQLLLFLADSGNRRKLHLLDRDGRLLRDLTPFPLRNLNIDALSRQLPEKVAVWIIAQDVQQDGLYLIDMEEGEAERKSPRLGYEQRYYDGYFQLIAARRPNASGGQTVFVRRGGQWEELVRYPFDEGMLVGGLQQVLSVSENGKRLYLTDNLDKDKTVLIEYDIDSSRQRILVADAKVDILPEGAIIGADGWPQMVQGLWASPRRHYLHAVTRRDFEWLDAQWQGQADFVDRSADNRTWLLRRLDGGPTQYYLFRRGKRQLIPLFNDLPALDTFQLAFRYPRTMMTRDSLELPIHVYLPPDSDKNHDGVPDTLMPTLLYVHGGPWAGINHWNSWFHNRNFQLLADRGYVVINTEFRGTTGLGKRVTRLGDRQWGENMHYDIVDIANWAVKNRIADPDKLGIWGWSYGGYAAAAALAFAPEQFSCGISMYGPADLDAFSRIPFTDDERWRATVGNPLTEEGTALLQNHSPFHHVDRIVKPILLTTGAKDDRVPKTQVDAFARALAETNKEVVYFYYPEEGHDYADAKSWVAFWTVAERFLHDYLGGQFGKAGEALKEANVKVVYGKEYIEGLED